ncbi:xanthine dehydrogenase accessory protein XdhC [Ornithinimicrobium cavernae]|uniref:xanthine dehydrogenase accessory protein XdhC n=1 Tax=Ornithinimicrobium cavernae TaxID=2666047 RepID=UPI000D69FFC7|nr:xanthine dehydrogenase accessory protein XdhC [Ornithinimicrobium cavernae]
MDWLRALAHLREEGRSGVLVTVTAVRGHAPREAGAKMVVGTDDTWDSIGGGNLEASAVGRARQLLAAGTTEPERLELSLNEHATTAYGRQCCGGEVSLLLEPLAARPVVAVFGLGHVGQELARTLSRLPLVVHLVDSRAGQVQQVRALGLDDAIADLHPTHAPAPETVLAELPPHAHVLVMTHDHAEDLVLCDAALRRGDLGSVGVIGSSAKWQRFRKRLREAGHPEAAVATITSPIGLPGLPGKEPAVIAISVAAALLQTLQAELVPTVQDELVGQREVGPRISRRISPS